jgi:hypothetical protein
VLAVLVGAGLAVLFGGAAIVGAIVALVIWSVASLLGSILTPILDDTNSPGAWFFSFLLEWIQSPINHHRGSGGRARGLDRARERRFPARHAAHRGGSGRRGSDPGRGRLDPEGMRTEEALRVAEASGNEALRAETLTFVARRHIMLGNLFEGRSLLDESIRIATSLGHEPALVAGLAWRGLVNYFQSEYESAERTLARALDLSSGRRDSVMVFFCL